MKENIYKFQAKVFNTKIGLVGARKANINVSAIDETKATEFAIKKFREYCNNLAKNRNQEENTYNFTNLKLI